MPNRTIRESARSSATLYELSHGAERMFWRLTTVACDYGRFEADPCLMRAACFPRWGNHIRIAEIERWYAEMEACCLVTTYVVGGKRYGIFNTWEKHQRIRAKHPKYPAPPVGGHLLSSAAEHRTSSTTEHRTTNIEREALSGNSARRPPSPTFREEARTILAFLNEHAGKSFRESEPNLRLIAARLKSGATVENCKGVVARKVREWARDPKMARYLRPATLFAETNFEQYLGERSAATTEAGTR